MRSALLFVGVVVLLSALLSLPAPAALSVGAAGWAAQFQDINSSVGIPVGHGVAWGDYDGDGYVDLFVTGRPGWPKTLALYHNNHDLTFTDVTARLGISTTSYANAGVAWADLNNDGRLDVFVGGDGNRQDSLYRGNGTTFTDIATAVCLTQAAAARTAGWCDYDGDGLMDLCATYVGPGRTGNQSSYRHAVVAQHWYNRKLVARTSTDEWGT